MQMKVGAPRLKCKCTSIHSVEKTHRMQCLLVDLAELLLQLGNQALDAL